MQIIRLEGVRVYFRCKPSRRNPKGEGDHDAAYFLQMFSPVSNGWRRL